jgi:hypothetical protein
MRPPAAVLLGAALAAAAVLPSPAQPAGAAPVETQATVSYQFDRIGMTVPHFTLQIREDGTGSYQADPAGAVSSGGAVDVSAGKHVDRPITLTPPTVTKIFQGARAADHFNLVCNSKAKNIADTGKKTLSYAGPDGKGSCIYNYSENKNIMMLTDTFSAIAFTLDEGRRLEFLHRYDRLGLDAEMTALSDQVKIGSAIELGLIEPTLTSIANDTALIQRVRLRAAKLVEESKSN